MDNLSRIKKISQNFYLILTFLIIIIPLYYIAYWVFINYLPDTLITVNWPPESLIPNSLTFRLRIIGFVASLLPLSSLMYVFLNVRKLFSLYRDGIIFSSKHVGVFKNIAGALILWVTASMVYASIKSVLFSVGSPPGRGIIEFGIGSAEITALSMSGMALVISWIMDEGRILEEEKELTI